MAELRSSVALRVYGQDHWGLDRFLGYTLENGACSVHVDDDVPWYVRHVDSQIDVAYVPVLLNEVAAQKIPGLSLAGCRRLEAATWPMLAQVPHLTRLDLFNTHIDDAGVAGLTDLQQLVALNLSGTNVTDACVDSLLQLPRLETLQLGWTALTDHGLARLTTLRSLKNLDLSGTRISDAGLTKLADLEHLVGLGLQETALTDRGVTALLPLAERLERLELGYTEITSASVSTLTRFSALRCLVLRGTQVDRVHDAELVRAMPALAAQGLRGLIR